MNEPVRPSALALTPLLVFLALFFGAGLYFTSHGEAMGFYQLRAPVAILEGCVQKGLYDRVNRATVRTLRANGFRVVDAPRQDCCGALHAHGGDLDRARALARRNIDAFEASGAELIVVNAAGCGAAMKEYGTLLSADGAYAARARAFSARVRDVTELLAEAGPRSGAPIARSVAGSHRAEAGEEIGAYAEEEGGGGWGGPLVAFLLATAATAATLAYFFGWWPFARWL